MIIKKLSSANNACIHLRVELLTGSGRNFKKDYIVRIIDIQLKYTLDKLHEALFKAFDRYDYHLYEFSFGSDQPCDEKSERYGIPMNDTDVPFFDKGKLHNALKTSLASLELKPGDVFYYLFDFGDDW